MKKNIIVLMAALALVALIYFGYPVVKRFAGWGEPVSPSELVPGATAFGNLKVIVSSQGKPVANLEVDLGKPGGRMSYVVTDSNGLAFFKNVPVGTYNIFFNDFNYPKGFERVSPITVEIMKNQITHENIELKAK